MVRETRRHRRGARRITAWGLLASSQLRHIQLQAQQLMSAKTPRFDLRGRTSFLENSVGPNNKLSVSTAGDPASPGNPSGLLGNPAHACNGVPIGYASLSQPSTMPRVPAGKRLVLNLSYHIYTFDRNMGLIDNYDRFDVLFNGNRALSDMNQSRNNDPGCAAGHDLGRKAVSIPVMGNPGDNINVTFRLADLPDALYNTYVYVDDVHLHFE